MNLTKGNLIRAAVGGGIVAGITFFGLLSAIGGQGDAVNWLSMLGATGSAFFGAAGTILGVGPGVTEK